MLPISENSTFERKNACWQNNKSRLIVTEKWYNLREYDANYGTVRGWKFNERLATWNFSHKFSLTLLPLTYFTVFSAQYFVLICLVLAKKNWSWPRLYKSDANYGIVRSSRLNERSLTFVFLRNTELYKLAEFGM